MEYVVIFEKGENSYGASVPDLPGCIAVGKTMEEVKALIAEAIEFHIEGLREDGDIVPAVVKPHCSKRSECIVRTD
ncbi:type II toxin-antitoxin system HicB family antitoxin [Candidatus Poribacteria bacterium]|nr:type II toxin-antitoxin system HicB family antitoxin [Candidatus Poribacteria bacterium]